MKPESETEDSCLVGAKKWKRLDRSAIEGFELACFPETYQKIPCRTACCIPVTVNAVKKTRLSWTMNLSGVSGKTVDEYKESIRADLLNRKAGGEPSGTDIRTPGGVDSHSSLIKNAVSKRYNTRLKQYEQQAKMYGAAWQVWPRPTVWTCLDQEAIYAV